VIYDYNLDTDFNQYDTYVLCVEDFFVENTNHPNIDNPSVRNYLRDAVDTEMINTGHKTNVLKPQLQAGFRLLISEKTVEFENCEHSAQLEYWESCTIHQETYEHETLVVYVADFNTNKVLWHASVSCDLNIPKKKLEPTINKLVKDLFATYPKNLVHKNPDDFKEN
jgi:hypothetical protein